MTFASAPGKIILFGEHAVVYGRPALAVPVMQVHADAEVTDSSTPGVFVNAPDISLRCELAALPPTHPLRTVIESVFVPHPSPSPLGRGARGEGLHIRITSTIPVASGMGSGAAVSVAVIRALSAHLGLSPSDEQVNQLCYETEKIHHGTPSGIDNTVITYAKPVFFIRGQPIRAFNVSRPFTIVIGDTGVTASTRESVGDVRKLWEADKGRWEAVFDRVAGIVQEARNAIETGEIDRLGPLMDANQALLQEMTVSSPELDRLALAAKASGAEGAKLSGGGRGGNMIALAQPGSAEKVASALLSAGAKRTFITIVTG